MQESGVMDIGYDKASIDTKQELCNWNFFEANHKTKSNDASRI